MRTTATMIRRLSALCALCLCILSGASAAAASAASPTVRNDRPSPPTDTAVTLNGTVSTESTLTDCHFEYVEPRAVGGGPNFPGESPRSIDCASSDGSPIAGPAEVPADSEPHAVSAELPLAGPGASVYYRLVAANADGPTTAAGWQASGFGAAAFDGLIADPGGSPLTQAGHHPFLFKNSIAYNSFENHEFFTFFNLPEPLEDAKDATVTLPPGFLGSLAGVDQCTASELAHPIEVGQAIPAPLCSSASQIGVIYLKLDLSAFNGGAEIGSFPVFNMVPPPGVTARFAATFAGTVETFDSKLVPSGGGYRAVTTASAISQGLSLLGNTVALWGVPSDPIHEPQRSCPGQRMAGTNSEGGEGGEGGPSCPSNAPARPFFRTPTSCTAPGAGLQFDLRADSWQHPGDFVSSSFRTHEAPGYPEPPANWGSEVGMESCEQVPFEPTLDAQPTVEQADSPSGLSVDLGLPTDCWDPKATAAEVEAGICQSDLRSAQVTLPEGVSLNPAAAGGRQACTPAQAGVTSPLGSSPVEFDDAPLTCPNASKIGSVEIATPLLDEPIEGTVYLAQQSNNPFQSLLAMYLVAEGQGVRIKQAGQIELGPDGRVTTSFDQVPQTPFSNIHLELFGGPRAALRTPPTCGTYTTQASFTPWSGNGAVQRQSSFQITECPNSGFDPKLEAGTQNPLAGSTSPFHLRLSRADGTSELGGLQVTLPPGLSGYLTGIPYCPDSTLAAISTALGTGASEIASPSCPAASQVGTTIDGAGAGTNPFYTSAGRVYLAGPYKGAPLSLAVVTPVVAGPFDLGTVVVRNALRIDPNTVQITAISDPLPQVIAGIPLDLRDIRVELDRDHFTLNPTSCEPKSIDATLTSTTGATAQRSNPFQAAGCDRLGFKPKLTLALKGPVHRSAHPALAATYTTRPGDANLARAQVKLPPAAFLDNSHIGTVCTRPAFAAHTCPPSSVYGKASATSPILGYPLYGSVYLRSSNHKLPDLVADLRGPDTQPIEVALAGKTDSVKGALRNTFELVPDAPVTRFHLSLFGKKRGLIVMSSGFCAHPDATVKLDAQNGRGLDANPRVKAKCGKSGRTKRHHRGNGTR